MYITYQTRLCCLFFLLSAGFKLTSSREDDSWLFYVTPTQPPNPGCPKNNSCQTFQYLLENELTFHLSMNSCNKSVTLMFLSGNHTVAPVLPWLALWFPFILSSVDLSMVGLDGNIVIHSLGSYMLFFPVIKLTVENL
jgi:hypothetical protein